MVQNIIEYVKKYCSFLIIYVLLLVYLLSWLPKEYNHTFKGVKYRLNSNETAEETVVDLKGKLIKPLLGQVRFTGIIKINEVEYNILDLKFDKFNSDSLEYWKPFGATHSLGIIYFDESYQSFTITLFKETGINNGGWSSEDGLMITAPAENRTEAINLANSHLQKFIRDKGIRSFQ